MLNYTVEHPAVVGESLGGMGILQDNLLTRPIAASEGCARGGWGEGEDRIPHSASLQPLVLLSLSVSRWIDFCLFQSNCAKQVSRAKGLLSYDPEYAN